MLFIIFVVFALAFVRADDLAHYRNVNIPIKSGEQSSEVLVNSVAYLHTEHSFTISTMDKTSWNFSIPLPIETTMWDGT